MVHFVCRLQDEWIVTSSAPKFSDIDFATNLMAQIRLKSMGSWVTVMDDAHAKLKKMEEGQKLQKGMGYPETFPFERVRRAKEFQTKERDHLHHLQTEKWEELLKQQKKELKVFRKRISRTNDQAQTAARFDQHQDRQRTSLRDQQAEKSAKLVGSEDQERKNLKILKTSLALRAKTLHEFKTENPNLLTIQRNAIGQAYTSNSKPCPCCFRCKALHQFRKMEAAPDDLLNYQWKEHGKESYFCAESIASLRCYELSKKNKAMNRLEVIHNIWNFLVLVAKGQVQAAVEWWWR